jgi:hypothetical protein
MSIKISASQSAVAHHIIDGAFTFPYAIDAHSAVSRFPGEWSHEPWSAEAVNKARQASGEELEPLTAEEQAAVDEHAHAVAEANERLKARREKLAAEKVEADQVAADEALVKSPAPVPVKRPFGRKGEPTAAELKMVQAKKDADAQDAASRAGATITG